MFKNTTSIEHRMLVRKFIDENKIIESLFGEKWIKDTLLSTPMSSKDIHPLFYFFANPHENKLLLSGIKSLITNKNKKFIRTLKNDKDEYNIHSLIREIDTYALLQKKKSNELIWKLQNKDTNKSIDIRYRTRDKIFDLEIFCINQSLSDKNSKDVIDELHGRVNNMADNPFVISVKLFRKLEKKELEQIWKFLKKQVGILKKNKTPTSKTYYQKKCPIIKFEFTLPNKHEKGFWGISESSMQHLNSTRINDKIKDKLEKLQFPNNESINGFIIYLEDFMIDPEDVIDAVIGFPNLTFYENGQSKQGRNNDGVIKSNFGKTLLKSVDFILALKHPNNMTNLNKIKILINDSRSKITKEEIEQIFNIKNNKNS